MKIQFRPMLWPSIFSIITFIILCGFGTWQIKRLYWKEALIQRYITESQSKPISNLSEVSNTELNEFKAVEISGKFFITMKYTLPVKHMRGMQVFTL